jgi:U4/U6 small nuclear ribonucleoprotein PRP3
MNAQQYNLTGLLILYHGMNVVIVEGGPKGIKQYKKLMLRRIDWPGKRKEESDDDEDNDNQERELKSTPECALVWEGIAKNRAFKTFKQKNFTSDLKAREFLQMVNVVHYWDAARSYTINSVA